VRQSTAKETFGEVTAAFTGRGEATSKEEKPFPDGSKTETASWQDGDTTLHLAYSPVPLGGFVTGRVITVAMNYKKSS
jgi:hypothetical protein